MQVNSYNQEKLKKFLTNAKYDGFVIPRTPSFIDKIDDVINSFILHCNMCDDGPHQLPHITKEMMLGETWVTLAITQVKQESLLTQVNLSDLPDTNLKQKKLK